MKQRSKPKTKELHKKVDQDQLELIQHRVMQQVPQSIQQTAMCSTPQPMLLGQKVNVLQNISLHPIKEELLDQEEVPINTCSKLSELVPNVPVCSNENQAPRPKIITNIKPNTNITLKQTSSLPPGPSNEVQKSIKMCSSKKPVTKTVNSGQKLIVVSNAQTIPSNSILQRTLQIPFVKNVSIKNFEKFKIVTSNSTPTSIQVTNVTNSGVNSVKHKVVTVKTNPTTKKVIPFSQLQVLNSKGSIKVLPLGGKIVGKTMAATSSPLYIMNSMGVTQSFTKSTTSSQIITTSKIQSSTGADTNSMALENETESTVRVTHSPNRENGKSSVLEDILKASGVISEECVAEDYDTKIEEFHIPQNKSRDFECDGTEIKTIKSEEEGHKTEEVQNYNFTVLPLQTKENLEMTEISK
ncbi:hypothetical protein NQ314_013025 [Rhamnusium bicolor]|uniref:Uncharacterized protein n=1 Tax=Rhamnusium bicolor TaxID=1586634 RepID=A0AAV8X9D1_9CUCU|nr:hypothetical protein NQ314_013025 [Rhamnusium bicolor]